MADTIPGLMGFVVRVLKTNPDASSRELYDRSRVRYPAVDDLTVRQFHARYPLQAKRQLNRPVVRRFPVPTPDGRPRNEEPMLPGAATPSSPGAGASDGPQDPPRDAIRTLLFRLALDLETARTRADVVDVVARLDRYVDEAMKIGAGPR